MNVGNKMIKFGYSGNVEFGAVVWSGAKAYKSCRSRKNGENKKISLEAEFLDQNDLVSDLRGRFPLPVFSVQAA